MKRVIDWLRESVESRAFPTNGSDVPSLSDLRRTEWSDEFETLMRNRLLMGAFRYGLFKDKQHLFGQYDMLGSMRRRLDLYEQSENLEHLVDVANLCLVEFVMARQHGLKLRAIDDGEHVNRTN